jgi:hypothetical protein
MKRNILSLIVLATLAAGVPLQAEPTPAPDRTSRKMKKVETQKPEAAEGWKYVKGEWIHTDGYKYVKGQVVAVGSTTGKKPPKPPSKALLDSVKRQTPSLDPNSAEAKAAERERNLRQRPASQTGTHL